MKAVQNLKMKTGVWIKLANFRKQEDNYSHNLKVCIALLTLLQYQTLLSTLGKKRNKGNYVRQTTAPTSSDE